MEIVVFEPDFERWVGFRQIKKERSLVVKEKHPMGIKIMHFEDGLERRGGEMRGIGLGLRVFIAKGGGWTT